MPHRIAFAGASGTGKTSLARPLAEALGLPLQPSFSRLVAAEMGFASPYDVDALGQRDEFQRRVLDRLLAWQVGHHATGYVADRTVWDALVYTLLHASEETSLEASHTIVRAMEGLGTRSFYTRVILCPIDSLFELGADPARAPGVTYHRLFERELLSILNVYERPILDLSLIRCTPDARPSWLERLRADLASSPHA